jgi:hypothetical protein
MLAKIVRGEGEGDGLEVGKYPIVDWGQPAKTYSGMENGIQFTTFREEQ